MKNIKIRILGAILVLVCSFGFSNPAYAQNSSGLVIVPREDYTINPGKSDTSNLQITNLNNNLALNLTLKAVDFSYADQTGTPKLLLNPNVLPTTWSLKPYLSFPTSLNIPPGQTAELKVNINLPSNISPGSYYSGIEYLAKSTSNSSLNLSSSGATLLFVNVPGNVNENMNLVHVGGYQSDSSISGGKYVSFAVNPPSEIGYTLQNTGNVIESPTGSISLQSSYGSHNIEITNANPDSSVALIGQTRLFTACIQTVNEQISLNDTRTPAKVCKQNPSLIPGKYNITLEVFYGQNGKISHEIYGIGHFWYLPWWFIVIGSLFIILILFIILRIYFKLHKAMNIEGEEQVPSDDISGDK